MSVPSQLQYTSEHEWIDPANPAATKVGITDHAAQALGDIVFLDLPGVGDAVQAGSQCGEIESTKSVSVLYAPISGTVAQVNQQVLDAPELVNQDPYGEGWLFTVTPEGSPDGLLDAAAYQSLIQEG